MGDQQAPIGEVFYKEGASSYKYGSVPLNVLAEWFRLLFSHRTVYNFQKVFQLVLFDI